MRLGGQPWWTDLVLLLRVPRSLFTTNSLVPRIGSIHRFQRPCNFLSFQRMASTSLSGTQILSSEIEKPLVDDRDYRYVRLQNGLEALLIHDKETDKAAAALDVHVGSFADGDLPGLAHFCEHLLFMGNKKYPDEAEYSQFLARNAGSSNAYTSSKDTNYFFNVGHGSFDGALDRFAQFFISPLFLESCKDREILAVDSENKKNLQADNWRLYQLDKSLSNPANPYSSFSTGNLVTLQTIPASQNVDVRNRLLEFHKKYYSANMMKLCVVGRESLDELQSLVADKFSAVLNSDASPPKFKEPPYTPEYLAKIIYAKPVMDTKILDINFVLPDQTKNFTTQPASYYSHLIGHEGEHSLLSYLKTKGWANGITAGSSNVAEGTDVFSISVDLTQEGLSVYRDVARAIFQYIDMLKRQEPQEYIFNELRDIGRMNFKFQSKRSASDTASRLASSMQRGYPPDWILNANSIIREYDPQGIQKLKEYLNVLNSRITLVSQSYPGDWNQKEKWYGTEYKVTDIDSDLIADLENPGVNPAFALPNKNLFIARNFDVEKLPVEAPLNRPTLIKNTEQVKLWHKKDDTFWVPRGNIAINLRNPFSHMTPKTSVLTTLFVDLVRDQLAEFAYNPEMAGLLFNLSASRNGVNLIVSGYNEKLSLFLEEILIRMHSLEIDPVRYVPIKEKLALYYKNFGFHMPYNQMVVVVANLINEHAWSMEEKLSELEASNLEDVKNYIKLLFSQLELEILVDGNISRDEALRLSQVVEEILPARPLLPTQKVRFRSFNLPTGRRIDFEQEIPDPSNVNNCVDYYLEVCPIEDAKQRAILELLSDFGHDRAFDQLRTKEQLGYVVFSGPRFTRTSAGYRLLIQSERSTDYLVSRIERFLVKFGEYIGEITPERLKEQKKSIIQRLLEKRKNLSEEHQRYWMHIQGGYYDFLRHEKTVNEIEQLTVDDLMEFYAKYIDPSSEVRALLVIHLTAMKQVIPEPIAFGKELSTYLSIEGVEVDDPKVLESWEVKYKDSLGDGTELVNDAQSTLSNNDPVKVSKAIRSFVEDYCSKQAPVPNHDDTLEPNIVKFKSQLALSCAPYPIQDLALYMDSEPRL